MFRDDRVKIDGPRTGRADAAASFDLELESELRQDAEHQAELGCGLAGLKLADGLTGDPGTSCQLRLAEREISTLSTHGCREVADGSNPLSPLQLPPPGYILPM